MKRYCGFTLIELVVVITIVGILAGASVVSYRNTREKGMDKEAIAGLLLIRSAERQYFARYEQYWPTAGSNSNLAQINTNLAIDLTANWAYTVTRAGISYSARADRQGRRWQIASPSATPTCVAGCL